jgi:UDP-glucose 4-epimerase
MRILFTGASSFTGLWFARELASAGHHVIATLRRRVEDYSGLRRERIEMLRDACELRESCDFGSDGFLQALADARGLDVLCHHAAWVENYRSADFDVAAAFAANTRRASDVLRLFADAGGKALVITGSVFEAEEGAGTEPRRAFSPYGVSKTISGQLFRYWAEVLGLSLGKFVVPNPFGPYEEPRFCAYLMQSWSRGETPSVKTPLYVRDNIHIGLLAHGYVSFVERVARTSGFARTNPTGYVESQGAFARRFANEIGGRLRLSCPINIADQVDFSEPLVRINFDQIDRTGLKWDEREAWDTLARYYSKTYLPSTQSMAR